MKQLVLLGGGHAHVAVLAALADRPLAGWDVHLVTPYARQVYSGMLPGWIAGHYALESCALDLGALAARAGVGIHLAAARELDPVRRVVAGTDGRTMPFDLLSIDTGSAPSLDDLPGASRNALPIRPIEAFISSWPGITERISATRLRFDLAVVGAGAAGVELAFAIQRRARVAGWSHLRLALIGRAALPVDDAPLQTRRRVRRLLQDRGIEWMGAHRVTRIDSGTLQLDGTETLDVDACLVVTGSAAPGWPKAGGLATDERGFILVGSTLQSVSHPDVFAAGDIAAYREWESRPKSGVFAVRAGPVLAENIRAACDGRRLRAWSPQRRALYLISTGERHAVANWGRWTWSGNWVWRWKDRIDRRFMRRNGTDC